MIKVFTNHGGVLRTEEFQATEEGGIHYEIEVDARLDIFLNDEPIASFAPGCWLYVRLYP